MDDLTKLSNEELLRLRDSISVEMTQFENAQYTLKILK